MSIARTIGIVLTGLIGLSGLGVGLSLWLTVGAGADDGSQVGLLIGPGIAAYGLITALGAYGIWRGNRLGWWVAVVAIAAGLVLLIRFATLGIELDEAFTGGAIIWGADLVALLAPGTRRSLWPAGRQGAG
jgi:hypothetical protein